MTLIKQRMIGAIVGIGKIGLRHLEGSINSNRLKQIYLFDLDIHIERPLNLSNKAIELIFLNSLEDLPQELDLLILSTSANSRLSVLQSVLYNQVHNLLLEKVVLTTYTIFLYFKSTNCPKSMLGLTSANDLTVLLFLNRLHSIQINLE